MYYLFRLFCTSKELIAYVFRVYSMNVKVRQFHHTVVTNYQSARRFTLLLLCIFIYSMMNQQMDN